MTGNRLGTFVDGSGLVVMIRDPENDSSLFFNTRWVMVMDVVP